MDEIKLVDEPKFVEHILFQNDKIKLSYVNGLPYINGTFAPEIWLRNKVIPDSSSVLTYISKASNRKDWLDYVANKFIQPEEFLKILNLDGENAIGECGCLLGIIEKDYLKASVTELKTINNQAGYHNKVRELTDLETEMVNALENGFMNVGSCVEGYEPYRKFGMAVRNCILKPN